MRKLMIFLALIIIYTNSQAYVRFINNNFSGRLEITFEVCNLSGKCSKKRTIAVNSCNGIVSGHYEIYPSNLNEDTIVIDKIVERDENENIASITEYGGIDRPACVSDTIFNNKGDINLIFDTEKVYEDVKLSKSHRITQCISWNKFSDLHLMKPFY